jgi:Tfp pilus assembly protein PilN
MTTTQTAEQIAEAMDNFSKFNNLLLGNHKSHMPDQHKEAAAMLHQQAAEIERLKVENAALRLDAERYRAVRKATITEDDAFLDELDAHDAPKTEAEFDAIFDAARAALGVRHD